MDPSYVGNSKLFGKPEINLAVNQTDGGADGGGGEIRLARIIIPNYDEYQ